MSSSNMPSAPREATG